MQKNEDGEWIADDPQYYKRHRDLAVEIFGKGDYKQIALSTSTYLPNKVKLMHPSVRDAVKHLIEARRGLVRAYKTAEKDIYDISFRAADGVHEMLRECFAAISARYDDLDLHMEPVPYE